MYCFTGFLREKVVLFLKNLYTRVTYYYFIPILLGARKIIRTNVAELSKDERGFIRLKLLNTEADFDFTETKNQFEAACFLSNKQPYKVLVDTHEAFVSPDKEAGRFITSAQLRYAEALIITSLH